MTPARLWKYYLPVLATIMLALSVHSCKKPLIFSKGNLEFSNDTVLFDTVFTTLGSTTQWLRVHNRSARPIEIEEVQLMGGSSSPFRINLDGISGTSFTDISIAGNDSLWMFVEVTLQVNGDSLPLVVTDSVRFRTNGVDQYVQLVVWGQDAYFHTNEAVSGVWASDKPHVLYGVVYVDSAQSLTIPAGTRVHGHKNAILFVYKGTLQVDGIQGNEVIFEGDRLESFYEDVEGQWYGVWIRQGIDCHLNNTIIRNGVIGLTVDTLGTSNPQVQLRNSQFVNMSAFGLRTNANADIYAENCLFANAGQSTAYLFAGNQSEFRNCTFANYYTGSRDFPSVLIQNNWKVNNVTYERPIPWCRFYNCVIDGSAATEFLIDTIGGVTIDMDFDYDLIKTETPSSGAMFSNIIWNQDPLFTDPYTWDFTFDAGSPLDGAGSPSYAPLTDIQGVIRNASAPDLGCYEN